MKTNKSLTANLPNYSLSEEIINSITHGIGAIFGIAAIVLLLRNHNLNLKNIMCFSIYGASLIVLYTVSTLYHALKVNKTKAVFRKLDHCCIFLLIAGTYTPISLLFIKGSLGLTMLSIVWTTAILGIVLNSIDVNKFSKFSLACYIIMSWALILVIKPLMKNLSERQIFWLFLGGAFYTFGAVIYVLGKKVKFMHSVWHAFALLGSVFHFLVFC